jgi:hypothetical protein
MNRPVPDFSSLRQEGIALVQALSGDTWTDYNLHDPGVTILEALCYAMTDLAYRTDFPIADILADPKGLIHPEANSFFPKADILVSNPVTINDYRKVLLDQVPELYNVWLEPVTCGAITESLQGLYRLTVQVRKDLAPRLLTDDSLATSVQDAVRKCLVARRNVCEDVIDPIIVLKPASIKVSADIEVDGPGTPEAILSNIYSALEDAINPPIPFFSEDTLRQRGYTVEDLYAGPALSKGFIPDDSLLDRPVMIDPSELIKAISQVDGVKYVRKLNVTDESPLVDDQPNRLAPGYFPCFDDSREASPIRLFHDGYQVPVTETVFQDYHLVKRETARRAQIPVSAPPVVLKGVYRDPAAYHSIQYLFPGIYGLTEDRFPKGTTDTFKGQVKQLKAYLLFFEQVLANHLAQLGQVRNIFSPHIPDNDTTHAYQPLFSVPGIQDLLVNPNGYEKALAKYAESPEQYKQRKHKILDHLLARFNEQVSNYPALQSALLYGAPPDGSAAGSADGSAGADESLVWKARLLQGIALSGRDRNRGFDYLNREGGLSSGLGARVADLLDIRRNRVHDLTAAFKETNVIVRDAGMGAPDTGEPHRFLQQKTSFFRTGIDAANYKISLAGGLYEVRFQPPDGVSGVSDDSGASGASVDSSGDDAGQLLGRYPDEAAARRAINGMVRALQQININSEGFHVMEHILLRPSVNSPSYGFRFFDREQRVLLQHLQWASWDDRSAVIADLLEPPRPGTAAADGLRHWGGKCRILLDQYKTSGWLVDPGTLSDKDLQGAGADYDHICRTLLQFRQRRVQSYPRFNMLVRGPGDQLLEETFLNFTITVVLPSWPARFQDRNFKTFAENLFRVNTPAHIRLRFQWVNISRMTVFEQLYGKWTDALRDNGDPDTRDEWSRRLISFLLGNQSRSV